MSSKTIVSSARPICLVGGSGAVDVDMSDISQWVSGFVGVDSGADTLLQLGIDPLAVVGDLDSISERARATFSQMLHFFDDQSTTDFEKALSHIAAPAFIAVGFTGGRMDHTLSVLSVMRRFANRQVLLTDAHDVSFLAPVGQLSLNLPKGTRVSVMPVAPATVTLSGVGWPFGPQPMDMAGFTSPSNVAVGGDVRLVTDAPVLVTVPRRFLPVVLQAVVRG